MQNENKKLKMGIKSSIGPTLLPKGVVHPSRGAKYLILRL